MQDVEEAKGQSSIAGKLLESLMDILRKHKIRLRNSDVAREPNGRGSTPAPAAERATQFEPAAPSHEPMDSGSTRMTIQEKQLFNTTESGFGEIWQEYVELGPNSDVTDWDHLFSDLDSHVA